MRMWIWIVLGLAALLSVILVIGSRRVNMPRVPSREGIEDGEAARAYDTISRWPQFRFLREMIVRELKKHRPHGILVDVGCGPGYLVAAIVKSIPRLSIIGVDISLEMVKAATINLSSIGFAKRVEFRLGDVEELPFRDNEVDFVVSTLSLHHWQNPSQALVEICRILKPDGQFLIFDLRRDSRRLFYWLLRFAQTFVVPPPIRNINEPTGSLLSSYTAGELETLLGEIPLEQRKIKPGFGWLFSWARKGRPESSTGH